MRIPNFIEVIFNKHSVYQKYFCDLCQLSGCRFLSRNSLPAGEFLECLVEPLFCFWQTPVGIEEVKDVVIGHAGCHHARFVTLVGRPKAVEEREGGDPGHRLVTGGQAGETLPR